MSIPLSRLRRDLVWQALQKGMANFPTSKKCLINVFVVGAPQALQIGGNRRLLSWTLIAPSLQRLMGTNGKSSSAERAFANLSS
jgi:hypothetical protein